MKRKLTFALKGLFLLVCWCALATAYANASPTYTDVLSCNPLSNCNTGGFSPVTFGELGGFILDWGAGGSGFAGNTFGPLSPAVVSVSFGFFDTAAGGIKYGNCEYPAFCDTWGGPLEPMGTITMSAVVLYHGAPQTLTFAGTDGVLPNGPPQGFGYFQGWYEIGTARCPTGCGSQDVSFPFAGQWSNGWESTGTMLVHSQLGKSDSGNLVLNTQTFGSTTPEPSTLLMLGSGVLGLAGMIRLKLTT